MEVSQLSKYFGEFCGKYAAKRKIVGIFKAFGKVKAKSAYECGDHEKYRSDLEEAD